MSDELQPARKRRVVERPVTLEEQGGRATPVAVCPRKLKLVSLEGCGTCESFAGLCINPEERAPFLRCAFEESAAPPSATVADVMTCLDATIAPDMTLHRAYDNVRVGDVELRSAFLVGPAETLGYVAAVMAYERVHCAIVIDTDRKVLGLVDVLDIARWLACREGYIVPGYDTGK